MDYENIIGKAKLYAAYVVIAAGTAWVGYCELIEPLLLERANDSIAVQAVNCIDQSCEETRQEDLVSAMFR